MKHAVLSPLCLALLLGVTACTTPVSQLKRPQEPSLQSNTDGGGQVETFQGTGDEDDPPEFGEPVLPIMISFGESIRQMDLLLSTTDENGQDVFEAHGYESAVSTANTFQFDAQAGVPVEILTSRVEYGTKNFVKYACQGIGDVLVQISLNGKEVVQGSVHCGIPAHETSFEVKAPRGSELTVSHQPSPQTRGIFELALYD